MLDRIPDDAPPGPALQGILLRLVASVQADIDALPGRRDERVHDIRVGMKKFRALIRLAAGYLPKKPLARADKLARSLKEHFGATRDRDVLAGLLKDLPGGREAAGVLGISHEAPAPDPAAEPAVPGLCRELTVLAGGLDLIGLEADDVREAWVSTYRRARRAMAACSSDPDDDGLFHEWRKRVKELHYQSAVLAALDPAETVARQSEEIAALLGSHHDLSLLCGLLASELRGSEAELAALRKKAGLACRAISAGGILFHCKPSQLLSE